MPGKSQNACISNAIFILCQGLLCDDVLSKMESLMPPRAEKFKRFPPPQPQIDFDETPNDEA